MDGMGEGCGFFVLSEVTLFEYNVSTILLPIVASLQTLEHVRFVKLSKCNTFLLCIMCE